ncbi:lipopolysaccharide assembly protein LapA domain-containing protein [Paenibacillus sp. FSL H8-0537]|uniref:LapA family protein n=1 Tax=Paenibacillus sp. FSL H8-0537 TaxID=2921399 RepID=UPI0031015346
MMKAQTMLISALLFAFVIALFAVINVNSVQVNFMFAQTQIPLILVILASTLLGGLVIGLFGMVRVFRLQRQVKLLNKQVNELTAEVERKAKPELTPFSIDESLPQTRTSVDH